MSAGPGCRAGPPERMVAKPKPYPADCRRDVVAIARKGEAPLSQIAKVYFCDPRALEVIRRLLGGRDFS